MQEERIPILVTGGAGFIGAHTCKALARAGFLPVAYDNLCTGNAEALRFGPSVIADLRDRAALSAAIEKWRVRAVIHFAASAYVGESMRDPWLYYDNNIGSMTALLACAQAAGVDKVVFSSSCATYGTPQAMPITEDTPQHPINPYGRTKLICEQMLADYAGASGLRFAALRYFNAAGADPEGELGETHDPETHLIPLALRAAAGGAPLRVFGCDYPTPDGSCIRDYIHVWDLAHAHVLALRHLLGGGESLMLNLGTGQGHSVLEILVAIARVTGRAPRWQGAPRRPGDPAELIADPRRAARRLGFRTLHSQLDTILRHAAPWFIPEMPDAKSA